jgi:hypothetical protein
MDRGDFRVFAVQPLNGRRRRRLVALPLQSATPVGHSPAGVRVRRADYGRVARCPDVVWTERETAGCDSAGPREACVRERGRERPAVDGSRALMVAECTAGFLLIDAAPALTGKPSRLRLLERWRVKSGHARETARRTRHVRNLASKASLGRSLSGASVSHALVPTARVGAPAPDERAGWGARATRMNDSGGMRPRGMPNPWTAALRASARIDFRTRRTSSLWWQPRSVWLQPRSVWRINR